MVAIIFLKSVKSRVQILLAIGLCLGAAGLTGCASHARTANVGCVSAHGEEKDGAVTYNEIKITGPADPAAPRITLKTPDGQIVDRKSFTYVALKKAGFGDVASDPSQPSSDYDYKLSRYGALFIFFNGRLVDMYLSKTTNPGVQIARERTKKFYSLPLTQKQFDELFGRPEKVY